MKSSMEREDFDGEHFYSNINVQAYWSLSRWSGPTLSQWRVCIYHHRSMDFVVLIGIVSPYRFAKNSCDDMGTSRDLHQEIDQRKYGLSASNKCKGSQLACREQRHDVGKEY